MYKSGPEIMFDLFQLNEVTSQRCVDLKTDVIVSAPDTTTVCAGHNSIFRQTLYHFASVTDDQKVRAVSIKELYLNSKMSYLASGKRFTEINKNPFPRAI